MELDDVFFATEDLTIIYEGDGLLAKVVDMPAEDAAAAEITLAGISHHSEAYLRRQLDQLEWFDAVSTALKWQRLYGGAIAVMLADDGGGLEDPLQLPRVRSVEALRVYGLDCVTTHYSADGAPDLFEVDSRSGNFVVHPSRCLIFRSSPLPRGAEQDKAFWGVPLYQRIGKELRAVATTHKVPVTLFNALGQAVVKKRGLSEKLSTAQGEKQLLAEMETWT